MSEERTLSLKVVVKLVLLRVKEHRFEETSERCS